MPLHNLSIMFYVLCTSRMTSPRPPTPEPSSRKHSRVNNTLTQRLLVSFWWCSIQSILTYCVIHVVLQAAQQQIRRNFELLPSGRCSRILKARTKRLKQFILPPSNAVSEDFAITVHIHVQPFSISTPCATAVLKKKKIYMCNNHF